MACFFFLLHQKLCIVSQDIMGVLLKVAEWVGNGHKQMLFLVLNWPFNFYGNHFGFYCFWYLLWDAQGANTYLFAPWTSREMKAITAKFKSAAILALVCFFGNHAAHSHAFLKHVYSFDHCGELVTQNTTDRADLISFLEKVFYTFCLLKQKPCTALVRPVDK